VKHIAFKNKLYQPVNTGLFRHFVEVPDIEIFVSDKQPPFYWEGGKIPFQLWAQVVSFMKWTQRKFKAEAHCTLFYNTVTKEWAAWAFPQKTMGMTVALDTTDERYREDRKRFNGDWIMAGSVHHHCTSKAFQSSTDSADEMDKEGIHVTVGEVLDEIVNLHARKVFNGTMCECQMTEFFEFPDWAQNVPKHLRGSLEPDDVLGLVPEVEFPKEWESRISERSFPTASSTSEKTGRNSGTFNPSDRNGRTLVGGTNWTSKDYEAFQAQQNAYEKQRVEAIKRNIPQMEKILDDWALTVADHHGIDIKTMAELWLMPADEAKELTQVEQQLFTSISAMYKNLTIDKVRIPMLSIVDHMRNLAK